MTAAAASAPVSGGIIRWRYLWFVAAGLFVMIAAIAFEDFWFLNFIHVFAGLLWTGIDLFMGFFVGPTVRKLDISARRAFLLGLVPKTLFLLPTLSIITGTTGWYLAVMLGYTELPWPHFGWVAAALLLIGLMTVAGLGFLVPTNLRVCLELQKSAPDHAKIARMMRSYFLVVSFQGAMQIVTIMIMARFRAGL